ncbi:MAG: hypothetical protein ACOY3Y_01025 [Acidobacteriota bacterium]
MSFDLPSAERSASHVAETVAHDAAESRYGWLYALVALFVVVMALAAKTWGLVALGLTAVAFVPVMMVILIAITLGK